MMNECNYTPSSIGCVNQFVHVEYDSATSTIICQFRSQSNTFKSCTVTYGQCNQMLVHHTSQTGNITNIDTITLNVDSNKLECYVVTASIDDVTISVEGQRQKSPGNLKLEIHIMIVLVLHFCSLNRKQYKYLDCCYCGCSAHTCYLHIGWCSCSSSCYPQKN